MLGSRLKVVSRKAEAHAWAGSTCMHVYVSACFVVWCVFNSCVHVLMYLYLCGVHFNVCVCVFQ
jgi:hypothetical protein